MLLPVSIEPLDLWFQVQYSLSGLTWQLILRRSLNFCSCTAWFLDLDDLVRINRAWLYNEPQVSDLQANAKLVQEGECIVGKLD